MHTSDQIKSNLDLLPLRIHDLHIKPLINLRPVNNWTRRGDFLAENVALEHVGQHDVGLIADVL